MLFRFLLKNKKEYERIKKLFINQCFTIIFFFAKVVLALNGLARSKAITEPSG